MSPLSFLWHYQAKENPDAVDPKIRDVVTAMPVVASRVKYQQEVAKKKEKQEEIEFREKVRLAAQNTARRVRLRVMVLA